MRKIRLVSFGIASLLCLLTLGVGGAHSETVFKDSVVVDSGKQFNDINNIMQEMFWRARANDNTVFYENEYPFLRIDITPDKYLTGVRFRQQRPPNSDSLTATHLDSVLLYYDTAIAYLTTYAGDTLDTAKRRVYNTPQRLFYYDGRWIHPLSTTYRDQENYMKIIHDYEKAVERDRKKQNSGGN